MASRVVRLRSADSQAFSALGSPAFQDESAVFRAHANAKPVSLPPPSRVRLKCPLTFHPLNPRSSPVRALVRVNWRHTTTENVRNEPSMLANAFGECQRVWFVLQSALSFSSQTRRRLPVQNVPSRVCTFGLSPKFSTPVEKTVEIPANRSNCSGTRRFLPPTPGIRRLTHALRCRAPSSDGSDGRGTVVCAS